MAKNSYARSLNRINGDPSPALPVMGGRYEVTLSDSALSANKANFVALPHYGGRWRGAPFTTVTVMQIGIGR